MRLRVSAASLAALAAVMAWTSPSTAFAGELRWQFEKGETHQYVMSQTTRSTAEVQGQTITTSQDINMEMTWMVKDVSTENKATMVQTIDRIQFSMESPVGQLAYDSKEEDKPLEGPFAALAPIFKSLVNVPVEMTMTTQGTIEDVQVPQEMVDAMAKAGPAGASMGSMFGKEGLKKMMSQSMLSFPEESISPGKGWSNDMEVPVGPFGTMVTRRNFTYQGEEDGVANIGIAVTMELKPAENAPVEMSIKEQNSKGTILFDTKGGFLRQSKLDQRFRMTINVGDQSIEQEVETNLDMSLVEPTSPGTP